MALDQLGNLILNPSLISPITQLPVREYFAKWNNGISRTVTTGTRDSYDPSFYSKESKSYIDGHEGVLTFKDSNNNRIYIVDKDYSKDWLNVEMTVQNMRIGDYASGSDYNVRQLRLGIRSNHFVDGINDNPCNGRGYHDETNFNGTSYIRKEIAHPCYTKKMEKKSWTVPYKKWIGYKAVVQNCNNNTAVRVRGYRNESPDSQRINDWQLICDYTDKGDMPVESDTKLNTLKDWIKNNKCSKCKYGDNTVLKSPYQIFLTPGKSCYIRMNNIIETKLKGLTIREITPLP